MAVSNYESGKRFEKEIDRSLMFFKETHNDCYFYRIKDAVAFKARKGQMHQVPCDHIVIYNGKVLFLEEKSSRSHSFYAIKYIKEHQYQELKEVEIAGGISYFIIAKRMPDDNITEAAWAVPVKVIKKLKDAGIGRIYWATMDEYGIPLDKIKGRRIFTFNLEPIFK